MILKAFRIKNFKSIRDTGWCNLSLDNITGLIGQNESGKSSILEALNSFYTGEVDSDSLRNDESMPEVSCSFQSNENEFMEIFNPDTLPTGLIEKLIEKQWRVNLTCLWENTQVSTYYLEEKEVSDIFLKNSKTAIDNAHPNKIEHSKVLKEPLDNYIETVLHDINKSGKIKLPARISESMFTNNIVNKIPDFQFFEDNKSLLPNEIDLDDLKNENVSADGYFGVKNFLTIAEIDINQLVSKSSGFVKKKIKEYNDKITTDFREFWSQKIGKGNKIKISFDLKNYAENHPKRGKAYLEFWVDDGHDELHPKQRSQGVRWFLSFYLQLKASKIQGGKGNTVILIDEPGQSLHARAQEDVLKVFEDIKEEIQIIYTTHSPYLIKLENLYRLLAVQREDEKDDSSETLVFDAHKLGSASSDTLTPLFTNMGINVSHQNVIQKNNNVILEEPSAFFYLTAFAKLFNANFNANYLPATGADKIPPLANLFLGWGLDFIVILDNDKKGQKVFKELKDTLFAENDEQVQRKVILLPEGCLGIEDLFSNSDFSKFVLSKSSIHEILNSEYMKNERISKPVTAAKFKLRVDQEEISLTDFDEETKNKINKLLHSIKNLLVSKKVYQKET